MKNNDKEIKSSNPQNKRLTYEEKIAVIAAYSEGRRLGDIQKDFSISKMTIYNLVKWRNRTGSQELLKNSELSSKKVVFKLPKEVESQLVEYARKHNLAKSHIALKALIEFLNKHKDDH